MIDGETLVGAADLWLGVPGPVELVTGLDDPASMTWSPPVDAINLIPWSRVVKLISLRITSTKPSLSRYGM